MKQITRQTLILLLIAFSVLSCNSSPKNEGETRISGKVINKTNQPLSDSTVVLFISSPILEERLRFYADLEERGEFSFTFPVVYSNYAGLKTPLGTDMYLVNPGEDIRIDVTITGEKEGSVESTASSIVQKETLDKFARLNREVSNLIMQRDSFRYISHEMPPLAYVDTVLSRMEDDLSLIRQDTVLPDFLTEELYKLFKVQFLNQGLLDYTSSMRLAYYLEHERQGIVVDASEYQPQELERPYYAFLRHFDLNNPPLLNSEFYAWSLQFILGDKTLALPEIGDTPVEEWLSQVKPVLSELVGFDAGLFYDLLAASAYKVQMNGKVPLTDIQKENIKAYFQDPAYWLLLGV